jgi:hypothetical protein
MKIYKPPSEQSFLKLTPEQKAGVRQAIAFAPQRWEKSLLLAVDALKKEVQELNSYLDRLGY